MKKLSNEVLEMVAERFRVLADPLRLQILHYVGNEEKSVGNIVAGLQASQPNVSKHLKFMQDTGILFRRQEKNAAFYRVADPSIFQMCDMVCGALKESAENRTKVLTLI